MPGTNREVRSKKGEGLAFPEKNEASHTYASVQVEDNGLEPMTFWLPARRSPN